MVHHEQFRRAAIERGIPDDEVGRFAEFLRFAIWTGTSPNGVDDVPVGKWGGLPRLPVDMEWPSIDDFPLPFIASYDCAALPRVDDLALPEDGSLLFFLHHEEAYMPMETPEETHDEQNFARVVYVPAGTETAIAEEPDYDEEMYLDSAIDFLSEEDDVYATVAAELPRWLQDGKEAQADDEHLAGDLAHRRELRDLVRELWPESNNGGFYLGGFSMSLPEIATANMYSTPELGMARENLEAREKAGELVIPEDEQHRYLELETLRVMREWVPLAQFVPDEVYLARFMIRHDDLAACRFDKALSCTAFTE